MPNISDIKLIRTDSKKDVQRDGTSLNLWIYLIHLVSTEKVTCVNKTEGAALNPKKITESKSGDFSQLINRLCHGVLMTTKYAKV